MVAPVIYTFGTEDQKARFLPRILSSDDWWCQAEECEIDTPGKCEPLKGYTTVFGARLDDDVAGESRARAEGGQEEHEKLFDQGTTLLRKGEYKQAVTAFTQATALAPGGLAGRRGGQYAVYLAEALGAAGERGEGIALLKRCEAHPDQNVRKISAQVLYIMEAPELKLGREQFVEIPSLQDLDSKRTVVAREKDPPPEKYSLEWYVQEAEKKKSQVRKEVDVENERRDVLNAVAALAGAGTLAAVVSGGFPGQNPQ
jgi:tetratricopeptide (TPR) repeat protein